jgi:hypothetical protein
MQLSSLCDVSDQMEVMTADSPSPALFENMAHTYSSMNNYPKVWLASVSMHVHVRSQS